MPNQAGRRMPQQQQVPLAADDDDIQWRQFSSSSSSSVGSIIKRQTVRRFDSSYSRLLLLLRRIVIMWPYYYYLLLLLIIVLMLSSTAVVVVNANPSAGNYTLLIVLVQFPDHIGRILPDSSYFQSMCETQISDYMEKQSYGNYNIESCHVVDWSFTNDTEANFANGNSNGNGPDGSANFAHYILDTLDEYDFDWSIFDKDNDGLLDAVLFLHSGYLAEYGYDDPSTNIYGYCNANIPESRFQSIGGPTSTNAWISPSSSVDNGNNKIPYRLNGYAITSALDGLCSTEPAKMGIIVHEFLHTLGAIDLYDPTKFFGGLGKWDIMSWGILNNGVGPVMNMNNSPGSLSPYNKILLNWIEPILIEYDGKYEIHASNRFPDVYMISKKYPDGEYLLIENRQLLDYDTHLPGSGGILIYKVDLEQSTLFGQAAPGYPGLSTFPFSHYTVALLQPDGNYHLEKGMNAGDSGDVYTKNSRELLPGSFGFFPNSDSYQFGEWSQTGISITDISESNIQMSFVVTGLGDAPTTPVPTSSSPTPAPAVTLNPTPVPTTIAPTPIPTTIAPITTPIPTTMNPTTIAPTTTIPTTIAPTPPTPTPIPVAPTTPSPTPAPAAEIVGTPTQKPAADVSSLSPMVTPVPASSVVTEENGADDGKEKDAIDISSAAAAAASSSSLASVAPLLLLLDAWRFV